MQRITLRWERRALPIRCRRSRAGQRGVELFDALDRLVDRPSHGCLPLAPPAMHVANQLRVRADTWDTDETIDRGARGHALRAHAMTKVHAPARNLRDA